MFGKNFPKNQLILFEQISMVTGSIRNNRSEFKHLFALWYDVQAIQYMQKGNPSKSSQANGIIEYEHNIQGSILCTYDD